MTGLNWGVVPPCYMRFKPSTGGKYWGPLTWLVGLRGSPFKAGPPRGPGCRPWKVMKFRMQNQTSIGAYCPCNAAIVLLGAHSPCSALVFAYTAHSPSTRPPYVFRSRCSSLFAPCRKILYPIIFAFVCD